MVQPFSSVVDLIPQIQYYHTMKDVGLSIRDNVKFAATDDIGAVVRRHCRDQVRRVQYTVRERLWNGVVASIIEQTFVHKRKTDDR